MTADPVFTVTGSGLLIEQIEEVDSTNSELLRRDPLLPRGSPARAIWLVANRQTGGRGRRQRAWLSTPAASLTASLALEVPRPSHIGAFPLAAGLAVAQALSRFGSEVSLKWPNDIHVGGGKAGGILCEARARGGLTRLVVGCGLNLEAPAPDGIDQPAAGLFPAGRQPPRALLLAVLGEALLEASERLLAEGFEPFRAGWEARDLLLGRAVVIHDHGGQTAAVARGIDADGALLVELSGTRQALKRLLAEEVSVRPLSE